jgi:hypothetical protein
MYEATTGRESCDCDGGDERLLVGALARKEASTPPAPTLDLHHSHDGTRNKHLVKVP